MSKVQVSNPLLPSAPFLSKSVQAAPLAFIIMLWVYVYNPQARHNKSFTQAIYGLAWVTLIVALYNLYGTMFQLLKIPTDKKLLVLWSFTVAYVVYILIFICIALAAFSKDGKNVEKYMRFLQVGSWFYFFGFMIVPSTLDLGVGFLKDTANQVRGGVQDIKKVLGLKGQQNKQQQIPGMNML